MKRIHDKRLQFIIFETVFNKLIHNVKKTLVLL